MRLQFLNMSAVFIVETDNSPERGHTNMAMLDHAYAYLLYIDPTTTTEEEKLNQIKPKAQTINNKKQ